MVVILESLHGSRAYGLATETSDEDRKGIFVPDAQALHGFLPNPEQVEPRPECVHYDIRKFFRLAAVCNPTVIEVLFTEADDVLLRTPAGDRLLAGREAFLSRRAGDSFGRYGLSQLKRIKTHRRWLLTPPKERPERQAYGLPARTVVSRDQMGAAEALIRDGRLEEAELTPNFLELMDRERRYRTATQEWQQYQGWLAGRNPARARLEAEHGYDTKHAMHLVRLMRMAVEILGSGKVLVRRPDAEELRAIRRGALTFDELLEAAESLGREVEALARTSALPAEPDEAALNQFCADIVGEVIGR